MSVHACNAVNVCNNEGMREKRLSSVHVNTLKKSSRKARTHVGATLWEAISELRNMKMMMDNTLAHTGEGSTRCMQKLNT